MDDNLVHSLNEPEIDALFKKIQGHQTPSSIVFLWRRYNYLFFFHCKGDSLEKMRTISATFRFYFKVMYPFPNAHTMLLDIWDDEIKLIQ